MADMLWGNSPDSHSPQSPQSPRPEEHLEECPETHPNDTITILVATDNHLGYLEKDPVRGSDSFAAFAEILALARSYDVDLVLLAGDLFHDNKPSRRALHRAMAMLRDACFFDRPSSLRYQSDPGLDLPANRVANYMSPNLNVGLPVFSIHGNHDDPSGDGNLAALDLFAVTGLINYFGKIPDVDKIDVSPICLQKGTTKLALYGMGNVRDERLHRSFTKKKVNFYRPRCETDEWFNLLALHQNRVPHGPTNHLPESFLGSFLDLVVWGHEHECLIEPYSNIARDFHVTQPGSSVATSLSEGEARTKHVGILRITNRNYTLTKVRLKTVRPFIMDEIVLKDCDGLRPNDLKAIERVLTTKVHEMIDLALSEYIDVNEIDPSTAIRPGSIDEQESIDQDAENDRDHIHGLDRQAGKLVLPKPLIRLKVEYSGFTTFNPQRFGQKFVRAVANPKDILHFYRKRASHVPATTKKAPFDAASAMQLPDKLENVRVEDLVAEYLNLQSLDILPENKLGDAVRYFVEKDEKDAIKEFVDECLTETRDSLEKRRAVLSLQVITETEEDLKQDLEQQIQLEKRKRVAEHAEEVKVRGNMLPTRAGKKRTVDFSDEDEDDDSEGSHSSAVVKRGRGRGRGRAKPAATTTRGHGRGRGRGAKALNAKSRKHAESEEESVIVSDSEVEEVVNPPRTAAPKRVSASNSRSSIATTNKTEASSSRKEAKLKFGKLLPNEEDSSQSTFNAFNVNSSTIAKTGVSSGAKKRKLPFA